MWPQNRQQIGVWLKWYVLLGQHYMATAGDTLTNNLASVHCANRAAREAVLQTSTAILQAAMAQPAKQ
jgi:cysteine sulfinate desulfinase/cysteine desulfurase-like protein